MCNIADVDIATASYFEAVRPNRRDQYKKADQETFFANLKAASDLLPSAKKLEVFANEASWVS